MPRSILSQVLVCSLFVLGGCADQQERVALVQPDQTVDSAQVWHAVAADLWNEVSSRLAQNGPAPTTIALEPPAHTSDFSHAMDQFLLTEAVSHGVTVSADAPFTVTYDTQIVRYTPGANDTYLFNGPDYDDLIVTLSVTDGSAVRVRESKVFHILDRDTGLYQEAGAQASEEDLSNRSLVSSNWYSDTPHDVLPIVKHEDNQFSIMVDGKNGPVRNLNNAASVAADHCGSLGQDQAKFISQGYPTNDRSQIKVTYECL